VELLLLGQEGIVKRDTKLSMNYIIFSETRENSQPLRQGRRAKRYKRLHYVGGIIANDKQHYT
jgi:hypothetical protein